MGRITEGLSTAAKGLYDGAKKLMSPPKKPVITPKQTFLNETPEEYGKRLIARRSRKY